MEVISCFECKYNDLSEGEIRARMDGENKDGRVKVLDVGRLGRYCTVCVLLLSFSLFISLFFFSLSLFLFIFLSMASVIVPYYVFFL